MKRLTLLLLLLASGCATGPTLLEDFKVDQVRIRMVVLDSERISTFCEGFSDKPGTTQRGCAVWSDDRTSCDIYVVAPQHTDDRERFATIGHEVWHCFRGRFH